MLYEIRRKVSVIFGYRGSGKSKLAQWIATQYGHKALYYDTLDEVPESAKFDTYTPKDRNSVLELETVVKIVMLNHEYQLLVIDETNRFCPSKPKPLPQSIADLNDWCRHSPYEMGVIFIARRPVQLNQDLTELADNIFVFNLGGRSDIQYLNDIRKGLGDAVVDLPDYHFIAAGRDRKYQILTPVSLDKIPTKSGHSK